MYVALEHTRLLRTTEAIAANELRAAIVRGDLAPGEKIRQEATAEQLGISLIPLREALKTLATEGLLTHRPQRGYFVTELPADALQDIYAVRSLLEADAERRAMPHIDHAATQAMRAHLRTQERAAEDRDAVAVIAGNRAFHFTIFERCHNPWLLRLVTQLWGTVDPYRVLVYRRMWLHPDAEVISSEILAEHEQIISALEKRRHDRALQLLEHHRAQSETFLRVLVEPSSVGSISAT